MQRCPYLAEMKERFWRSSSNNNGTDKKSSSDEGAADDLLKSVATMTTKSKQSTIARLAQPEPDDPDETEPMLPSTPAPGSVVQQTTSPPTTVPTVVKVKPDGSGSRTVAAGDRPLSYVWIQQPTSRNWCCNYSLTKFPKNAKTSLFIITSALYCKLAVIVCLAFLLSEVITLNVPLHFFEAIFTYLYSGSILFFLYVFCYLLHDTTQKKRKQKKKEGQSSKGQQAEDEQVAADASASKSGERKQSFLQEGRHRGRYEVAERERLDPLMQNDRESMLKGVRKGSESKDVNLNDGQGGEQGTASGTGGQEKSSTGAAEPSSSGVACKEPKKPKTSQSDTSHGSFFLRVGTLVFGLGAMIYIGLELGSFFEIPMRSACYNILRGVNPLLQLIFTFMQMYFIFINARLRIHKFKIIARFGLMHVIATNLCVWLKVLIRECLKEITKLKTYQGYSQDYMIREGDRRLWARLGIWNQSSTTPDPYGYDSYGNNYAYGQQGQQQAGRAILVTGPPTLNITTTSLPLNTTCERTSYMGSVVDESAPYLFPIVIEYSLIAAAVVFVMWRNIGRNVPPKNAGEEGEDAQSGQESSGWEEGNGSSSSPTGPVDCVGASKGLFCGLLLLVTALICLILFFVLVEGKQLKWLAIYLADCSHAGLLLLSFLATLIGFIRVRKLRFHGDHGSPLRDLLLRVSVLGVFTYALFSLISGTIVGLSVDIPAILVGGTSALVLLQIIFQMLFISDVGRRRIHLPEHSRTKPGRQIVTLLMITNLTMWVVMTLEIRKVEKDPIQLNFFGIIPWILVQRVTLPLYIFHRFFSAVTLAEIWKNSYTLKYVQVATSSVA